jgi:ArsR family transcriptional regulator
MEGAVMKYNFSEENFIELADFFTAFSDTTRLKILFELIESEKTVTEISENTGFSQSAVSHQLSKLRILKLIKVRKEGKFAYYSLDDEHIEDIIKTAIEHFEEL